MAWLFKGRHLHGFRSILKFFNIIRPWESSQLSCKSQIRWVLIFFWNLWSTFTIRNDISIGEAADTLIARKSKLWKHFRLYELRQNGIRFIAGGKLYHKLKAKRMNQERDKKMHQYDWRKLIPNENSAAQVKQSSHFVSFPMRKKATPLDVVGETW